MELRGLLPLAPFSSTGTGIKFSFQEFVRPRPVVPQRRSPLISVVIPAHNEERYLGATLSALQSQDYPRFEVLVVANGCSDRTQEVARGKAHRLIVLSEKNLGMARNLGARLAEGDLLLFLDADTTLEPTALRQIAEGFSPQDAAGTLRARPDSDRLACRAIYTMKNFLHRWALHPGSSGVILCWKEQFLAVGGFDEGLEVRENSELIKRLKRYGGYKFIRETTATTSMRRYEQRGVARVLWLWGKLWFQSVLGDLHHRHYEAVR